MPKPLLRTLSYAIEDEGCARANRPLLFGCFQREHFYRQVESRWREMTRTAELAIVLADFRRARHPRGGPAEVPIGATDPLIREWVVVSVGATFSGCLVGFEPPGQPRSQRSFETIWSGERVVVREAARVCCGLVARTAPDLVDGVGERLQQDQLPVREELTALVELATRMVSYATTAR
jgi:DICT domain-containing protein